MRWWLALGAAAILSCTSSRLGQTDADVRRGLRAALAGDSVFIERRGESMTLVWVSWPDGARVVRWRSEPRDLPDPAVRLLFWNADRAPDLLTSLQYEEILESELRVAAHGGSSLVYATGADACAFPELRDVDGDGLLDLVEHLAGALTADECSGDPDAQQCQDAYPTEWLRVLVQRRDALVWAPEAVRPFYDSLSASYLRAKRGLDSLLASGSVAASSRCDRALADSLGAMGLRASRIAGTARQPDGVRPE